MVSAFGKAFSHMLPKQTSPEDDGAQSAQRCRINLREEASLTWFFGRGQSTFQRSTFAGILERIDFDAYTSTRCGRCRGEGILEDGGFYLRTVKNEITLEEVTVEVEAEHGGWCPRCRGTGSTPLRRKDNRDALLTARPTAEHAAAGGYVPDDFALRKYALVSRRLDRVASVDPLLVEALASYYGDAGARWGRTRYGRLFTLYALTPAGHKLVRMSMRSTSDAITLTAIERIGVEADLDAQQPKPKRRALLDAAARQAAELYDRMCDAWNASSVRKAFPTLALVSE